MTTEFTYRFVPTTGKGAPPLLLLHGTGADVSHQVRPIGHQLSQGDLALVRDWLTTAGVQEAAAPR